MPSVETVADARSATPTLRDRSIHLINPLWAAHAGSEQRTLALYSELKEVASVRLWSHESIDPELASQYTISRIQPRRFRFPKSGTFIFVGVYFNYGRWVTFTAPRRIILIYNTFHETSLAQNLRRLGAPHLPKFELVYASELMAATLGRPGTIEASPIDLERFVPIDRAHRSDRPFTIGRLSRDIPEKHHPADAHFYERLAGSGARVAIMGGSLFTSALAASTNIALLPVGTRDAVTFLHDLDCFYYRTDAACPEPYGRVVFEAMACGLPVVVHRSGGYVAFLHDEVDAFLFDTQDEAERIVARLRADPELRRRVGAAARRTVASIYASQRRTLREFYLR